MPRLLLATTNQGKIRELRDLLNGCGWEIVTPRDLYLTLDVEETGSTYLENATLKARGFAAASGLTALADDSGLEVDAIEEGLGVYSARYAGHSTSYPDKIKLLLNQLCDVPADRRTARFRTVVAIAAPDGQIRWTEGVCEGSIADAPRGDHGFGYDPIFIVGDGPRTMAELSDAEKNAVSHRARAAWAARTILAELAHANVSHSPATDN
jgi:XTP/dITP diphosphohydrolase